MDLINPALRTNLAVAIPFPRTDLRIEGNVLANRINTHSRRFALALDAQRQLLPDGVREIRTLAVRFAARQILGLSSIDETYLESRLSRISCGATQ